MSEENATLNFKTSDEDAGKRLDVFLSEKIENWSRARLQKLVDDGDVSVNRKPAKSSYKLRGGEEIEAELAETLIEKFEPENIALDIVFEDESFAVINKPAGIVVHPGAGVRSGTLANALAFYFGMKNADLNFENTSDEQSKIQNLKSKIGIVHRLDKDTSGLIVVAKNERVHEQLSKQFRNREVFKSYLALVHGQFETPIGKIETSIGRDAKNRTRMATVKSGRQALTLWKVRQRFDRFTLLDVEIKTGRTHQIRVHLASINRPVVGDEAYNAGRDKTVADAKIKTALAGLNRFFLHAERLSFTHPASGEKLNFAAPLPSQLTNFLELL